MFRLDTEKIINTVCGISTLPKFEYYYSITPSNFMILSEDKQKRKLKDFFGFLNILQKQIRITLDRVPITVEYRGKNTKMNVLQVFVASMEPLDAIFENLGYTFTIDEKHPEIKIINETSRDFSTEIQNQPCFGRAYTLYKMPAKLPPAWIHSVFKSFHKLEIHINPVSADNSMNKINNKEFWYVDNKSVKADVQKKINDIQILKRDLELSQTSMLEFTVNGFIFAEKKPQLIALNKEVLQTLSSINVRVTSSTAKQQTIVNGGGVSFLADYVSLSILYPFASADMLETPNGFFIGTNKDTDGPIIFDPDCRKNYNIYTAGTTGSGKSFTNKIIIKRFFEKRPDIKMKILIDPQGEMIEHAEYFGLDSLDLKPGGRYGLEPFNLFETKIEAVDIIGVMTDAPNEVRKEWKSICEEVKNVQELSVKSSPNAKQYLVDLVKGPISEIFKGENKFSDKMIISLKEFDGLESEGLVILLVMTYAWKRANTLPANVWKLLFCDEAWKMKKYKQASAKVGDIARQGRKISLINMLSTQTFSDLDIAMDDDSRLTELFDTKIIMHMSETAAKKTGKALDLTDLEIERIENFKQGNGLIMTSDNTIYAKFEATDKETKTIFNTNQDKGKPT
ncbi:MAG: hypothetical protein HRU07_09975 [Nitrosopumilus sp.]|nr:hypothetical protein [Nitrosopumilus sp.]NRA06455.1 hypothetical protein [Nitrosopumilus sp.]